MGRRHARWKAWNEAFEGAAYPVLFWIVFPVAAALALAFSVPAIGPSLTAAQGEGQPGTFTALRKECGGKGPCSWYGNFESADGTIHFDDVLIDGGVANVGDVEDALYEGERNPPKVYTANDSHDWIYVFFVCGVSLAYLLAWLYAVQRRRKGLGNWIDSEPLTKPPVIRDARSPTKTGHRKRRRKRR